MNGQPVILRAFTGKKEANASGGGVLSILTYPTVDYAGDYIKPDGGDWSKFHTAPLVNWAHDIPVGRGQVFLKAITFDGKQAHVNVGKTKWFETAADLKGLDLSKYDDPEIRNKIGEYTEKECLSAAAQVQRLVEDDIATGVSIEFSPAGKKGDAFWERGEYSVMSGRPALHFEKWNGLAYAHARQPVNPGCRTALADDPEIVAKAIRVAETGKIGDLVLSPVILKSFRELSETLPRKVYVRGVDLSGPGAHPSPGTPARQEPTYSKGFVSEYARQQAVDHDEAMPGGRFPIRNKRDLRNAIHDVGRANNPTRVKKWIKKRAKELGAEQMLPTNWRGSKSLEGADVATRANKLSASIPENHYADAKEHATVLAALQEHQRSPDHSRMAGIHRGIARRIGENTPRGEIPSAAYYSHSNAADAHEQAHRLTSRYTRAIDPENYTMTQLFADRRHSGQSGHVYETDTESGYQKQGRSYTLGHNLMSKMQEHAKNLPVGSDYTVHLVKGRTASGKETGEHYFVVAKHSRKDKSVIAHAVLTHKEMQYLASQENKQRHASTGIISRALRNFSKVRERNPNLVVKASDRKVIASASLGEPLFLDIHVHHLTPASGLDSSREVRSMDGPATGYRTGPYEASDRAHRATLGAYHSALERGIEHPSLVKSMSAASQALEHAGGSYGGSLAKMAHQKAIGHIAEATEHLSSLGHHDLLGQFHEASNLHREAAEAHAPAHETEQSNFRGMRAMKSDAWISRKIGKIMREGIKGKKVSQKQAVAVAYSMAGRQAKAMDHKQVQMWTDLALALMPQEERERYVKHYADGDPYGPDDYQHMRVRRAAEASHRAHAATDKLGDVYTQPRMYSNRAAIHGDRASEFTQNSALAQAAAENLRAKAHHLLAASSLEEAAAKMGEDHPDYPAYIQAIILHHQAAQHHDEMHRSASGLSGNHYIAKAMDDPSDFGMPQDLTTGSNEPSPGARAFLNFAQLLVDGAEALEKDGRQSDDPETLQYVKACLDRAMEWAQELQETAEAIKARQDMILNGQQQPEDGENEGEEGEEGEGQEGEEGEEEEEGEKGKNGLPEGSPEEEAQETPEEEAKEQEAKGGDEGSEKKGEPKKDEKKEKKRETKAVKGPKRDRRGFVICKGYDNWKPRRFRLSELRDPAPAPTPTKTDETAPKVDQQVHTKSTPLPPELEKEAAEIEKELKQQLKLSKQLRAALKK